LLATADPARIHQLTELPIGFVWPEKGAMAGFVRGEPATVVGFLVREIEEPSQGWH